jgi:PST family polysaccharide transporter
VSSGRDTLGAKVASGVAWNVATQAISQLSRIVVGVVLARLLTPHQFGVAGMALVFTNFLALFTDPSLGAALVQRAALTEADRSTVFWVTLGIGLLCTLVGIAVSGLVASFFGQPQVAALLAVLSIGFALNALSGTQSALAAREFAYRRLQLREIISVLVGAAVGIVAAAAGLGAWAIVLQSLAFSAAATAMIWAMSSWRPRFTFSRASLRDLGGFGAKLFGSRLLTYANLNGDNLLIGRFLGGHALGVYSLSYSVMFTPVLRIAMPFQQVLFPAYSRLQADPARLRAAWLRSKQLSAAVLAPVFLAFLVTAPDLIPVAFGAKWHEAIRVLQLLCVAGVAHSLVTLNSSVLQARGQAGTLLRLSALNTLIVVGAFAVGLTWGVTGVAGCYAAARWLLVLPDTWVTGRAVGMRPLAALRSSGTALPLAVLAALAAFGLRAVLVAHHVAPALRLVLVLPVGGMIYVGLLLVAAPALVREVSGLRGVIAGRAPAPAEGTA